MNARGIWSDAQIGNQFVMLLSVVVVPENPYLQKVTDAVHAKGSFIFLQL